MSMATLLSAGLLGIDATPIHVEIDISRGLPGWSTVGLAESAVKESKDRVLSAISNCGYEIPFRHITLNLAPADIKKRGTALDLPIAIGLLAAAGIIPPEKLKGYLLVGELSLTGKVRPVRGALSIAILATELKAQGLILPTDNLWETSPVQEIHRWGASDLPAVVEFFLGNPALKQIHQTEAPQKSSSPALPDLAEVRGQSHAKRALEIAASGFHNLLMVGPPGTGKSMLASRLPSILPPMDFSESLTTTKVYSMMGMLPPGQGLVETRPFRSPHHTISDAGLIGGGSTPKPGEVSLAHNGVLFLDELTEFRKNVLESLRQPLEDHQVTISRAVQSLSYPAHFLLVAAMNPCPCGHLGHPGRPCQCPGSHVQKYQSKISGPLLDRMDLQVQVPPLPYRDLTQDKNSESSAEVLQRVQAALTVQKKRFAGSKLNFNSQMGPKEIKKHCALGRTETQLLEKAIEKWHLSARGFHRVLKVARTIGDLAGSQAIRTPHLQEALGFRLHRANGHATP